MTTPGRTSSGPVTFQIGEFTFDTGSRLLLHRGVERRLSPKAQHLLLLLLAAQPRALAREELYDALWPSTFVCETNLASLVSELRAVLGDNARGPQYIRTVHGFGYAFCGGAVAAEQKTGVAAMLYCEERLHFLYDGENVIGRELDAHVVLTNCSVSRRHAVITIADSTVWLEDLGSRNGTYVDGNRLTTPVRLTPRAQIMFGAVTASISLRKRSPTRPFQIDHSLLVPQ